MSADNRFLSLDEQEVLPYDQSLRIPPLQEPLPIITASRPPALEPNASINERAHNTASKLDIRRETLPKAKRNGEDGAGDVAEPLRPEKLLDHTRVAEFVQLPKPNSKTTIGKPLPFKCVPILNELHEPPPSAARFPPITLGTLHEGGRSLEYGRQSNSAIFRKSIKNEATRNNHDLPDADRKEKAKRVCLRLRRRWTEEETNDLIKGVEIYGIGKWKKIINHDDFSFHQERTPVDLKDRYRTWRMSEDKVSSRRSRPQSEMSESPGPRPHPPAQIHSSFPELAMPEKENQTPLPFIPYSQPSHRLQIASSRSPSPGQITLSKVVDSGFKPVDNVDKTYQPTKLYHRHERAERLPTWPHKAHRNRPPRWTKKEDASLIKGYEKHGFAWTAIAKDPELCLSSRTGAQVRDRFRLNHPRAYSSSVPIPLSDVASMGPEPESLTGSISREGLQLSRENSQHLFTLAPLHMEKPGLRGPNRPFGGTSETSKRAEVVPDIQPRLVGEPMIELYGSRDQASRQSSVAADEARSLGILSLLNDETPADESVGNGEEDMQQETCRLPPYKYSYDDWATDSLTLPPVNWEDLAPRPLFEID